MPDVAKPEELGKYHSLITKILRAVTKHLTRPELLELEDAMLELHFLIEGLIRENYLLLRENFKLRSKEGEDANE